VLQFLASMRKELRNKSYHQVRGLESEKRFTAMLPRLQHSPVATGPGRLGGYLRMVV
jgi:hypothetical protein